MKLLKILIDYGDQMLFKCSRDTYIDINVYRVIQGVCGEKCGENYYLVAKTLVARGRIELPTPCFSDKCSTD